MLSNLNREDIKLSKVVVSFPGIGYHCDKPLLYYGRKIANEYGYDKEIKVEYSYDGGNIKGNPDKMLDAFNCLYSKACEQLDKIDFSEYEEVLFISKSIGTAVCAKYAADHNINCKKVLYTPLAETFLFEVTGAIAFTGTSDPWTDTDVIISKSREQNVPLYIYEGANHSLETTDTMHNINNIMDVMEKTKSYLM